MSLYNHRGEAIGKSYAKTQLISKSESHTRVARPLRQAGNDGEPDKNYQHDLDMAQQIGQVLSANYPGHFWFVEVDSKGKMVHISIPVFMGNARFNQRMREVQTDPGMKWVIRAGGEILERWRIPRAKMDPAAVAEAIQTRSIRGVRTPIPT